MTGTITRGRITRADLAQWDGKTATYSRPDATGGTTTGLAIGNEVDVLQVYGLGTERTAATINAAKAHIASTSVTLVFAPGTWTIDANVSLPINIVSHISEGCVFAVSTGITLTFGPVLADGVTHTSGAGTVVGLDDNAGVRGAFYRRTAAEATAGVTPVNYAYAPGHILRYGTNATPGTTDMASAFASWALTGHPLTLEGPDAHYRINSDVTLPTNCVINGNGAKISFAGTARLLRNSPSADATTTVSSGASQGSVSVVVASAAGVSIGQYYMIQATDFPSHWGIIKNVSGTTVTLDHPLPQTYAGTINFLAYNSATLRDRCVIKNVVWDGALVTGASADSGNVLRIGGYKDVEVSGCRFQHFAITNSFAVLVQVYTCVDVAVRDSKFAGNEIRNASDVIDIQDCRASSCSGNEIEGSHFGINLTRCGFASAVGNILNGRRTWERAQSVSYSVRGIKFTSCATAQAVGNYIDDYDSCIRVDSGFRYVISGNTVRNAGYVSGSNTSENAVSATSSNHATQFGGAITGNVIENCGSAGITVDNGATGGEGRVTITSNLIRRTNSYAIAALDRNCLVMCNVIEDWNLANVGAQGITYLDGVTIIGNRFKNTFDAAIACINTNFVATFIYCIRDNVVETANPLFGSSLLLENSGTSTIASGGTSIAVTHGLVRTPAASDIVLTPTENATNDPGTLWVSAIGATQFTINCRADPGASNLDVSWRASIRQPFTA